MTITNSVAMAKLDALAARKPSNGVPVQEVGAAPKTPPAEAPAAPPPAQEAPADGTMSLKERMRLSKEAAAAMSPPAEKVVETATAGEDVVEINGWKGTITVEGKKTVCTVTANGETEVYKHLSRDEVIKLAQAQTPQYVPPPVEAPAKKTRARRASAPAAEADFIPPTREFTVYIDVVTHNGPAIPELATLLEPLQEAVASAAGVDDYRLIPYDDAKKAVAVAFAKSFGGPDAPKGEYGVSSKVLDKYVLEVLMREAVIRKGVIW